MFLTGEGGGGEGGAAVGGTQDLMAANVFDGGWEGSFIPFFPQYHYLAKPASNCSDDTTWNVGVSVLLPTSTAFLTSATSQLAAAATPSPSLPSTAATVPAAILTIAFLIAATIVTATPISTLVPIAA
ncbi:unnamed protein product, partial [Phaeothamnion confervicola]